MNQEHALNRSQILDILCQLEVQLNDITELKTRYGLCLEVDDSQSQLKHSLEDTTELSFSKKSLRLNSKVFLTSSRIVHERNKKHPKRRLRWAVIDKPKLKKLLGDVGQRIGCLWEILAFEDRLYIRESLCHLLRNGTARNRNDEDLSCLSEIALDVESNVSVAGQMKRAKLDLHPRGLEHGLPNIGQMSVSRSQALRALKVRYSLLSSDVGSSGTECEVVSYDDKPVLVEFSYLGWDKVAQEKTFHPSRKFGYTSQPGQNCFAPYSTLQGVC